MSLPDNTTSRPGPIDPRGLDRWGWMRSGSLGSVIFLFYLANGREIGTDDTSPTSLMAFGIVRGDGIYLERLLPLVGHDPKNPLADIIRWSHGHIVSRYPTATAFLAGPSTAIQTAYYDANDPGWDRTSRRVWTYVRRMAKRSAAFLSALVAVFLHRILERLGLKRVAIPAVLAGCLGSDLWAVGSQALWQHGPAALTLTISLWLLIPPDPSRWRLFAAGVSSALLVAVRLPDVVFSFAILGWVAWNFPGRLKWFLPGPILGASLLIGSNLWYFDRIEGGVAELEVLHPIIHGLGSGPWSGELVAGFSGTLFSPSHGLFVFCPWIAISVLIFPFAAGRLPPRSVLTWLFAGLGAYTFVLSKYPVWWGGHCFGPRYWTDATPLFVVVLAYGLDWTFDKFRPIAYLTLALVLISIGIQVIGAFCYPSTWNRVPENVDRHHERLWDWRDCELTRCWRECVAKK